jgi:hypothetical protein
VLFRLRTRIAFRPHPERDPPGWAGPAERGGQRFRWSRAGLWAWLDLNQRPHPYQAYSRDAFNLVEPGTASSSVGWQ